MLLSQQQVTTTSDYYQNTPLPRKPIRLMSMCVAPFTRSLLHHFSIHDPSASKGPDKAFFLLLRRPQARLSNFMCEWRFLSTFEICSSCLEIHCPSQSSEFLLGGPALRQSNGFTGESVTVINTRADLFSCPSK